MKFNSGNFLLIVLLSIFFSCNSNNTRNKNTDTLTKNIYQLDVENTDIIWNGYKTTDKLKVSGVFNKFSCNREGQEFNSIDELVTGLQFSIKSSSSFSGDSMRDFNLKEYFFKYLTNNFEINGVLEAPLNDSINISFDIFGNTKTIPFTYKIHKTPFCENKAQFNYLIEIKGAINLEEQFNAIKAYQSIHNQCYELHKGLDGISMTWKEIDIQVKAIILNK